MVGMRYAQTGIKNVVSEIRIHLLGATGSADRPDRLGKVPDGEGGVWWRTKTRGIDSPWTG